MQKGNLSQTPLWLRDAVAGCRVPAGLPVSPRQPVMKKGYPSGALITEQAVLCSRPNAVLSINHCSRHTRNIPNSGRALASRGSLPSATYSHIHSRSMWQLPHVRQPPSTWGIQRSWMKAQDKCAATAILFIPSSISCKAVFLDLLITKKLLRVKKG